MRTPNLTLPPNTCGVLDQCLRKAKDPRVVRRAVAIHAVAAGWRRSDVAEAHGITVSSLSRWIERFIHEGVTGLVDQPRTAILFGTKYA